MADRLTQLQDCLDQLATQMYACLRYISTRHDYSSIEGQPDMNPHHESGQTEPNPAGSANNATATGQTATATQTAGSQDPATQTTAITATTTSTNAVTAVTSASGADSGSARPENKSPRDEQHQQQQQQPAVPQPAGNAQPQSPTSPLPDSRPVFLAALQELARDLIIKEQQIEALADSLPGVGTSEAAQVARIAELEARLREAERERLEAVAERERMLGRLDRVIGKVRGL